MLSNRDYSVQCKDSGIHVVAEMDTAYQTRKQRLANTNPTADVYSIAKLFTVTAIGMCVDRGLLTTEARFLDVMELPLPDGADERWKQVTIHMLLKHQWGCTASGLLDIDAQDASQYPTTDYLSLILTEPLNGAQGKERCYTDAAYYLLSRVVEKVSGKTLFDFLRPALMHTMQFREYAWSACPNGHTMGATGLFLWCEDVAKLGVLYLNGGVWNGTRLLSEDWCRTVLEREYEFADRGNGWYQKGGMYGQGLAISVSDGLAVAWQGHGFSGKLFDIVG